MTTLPDPDELRAKAIANRLRAQGDSDAEHRRVLMLLADEYDELANALEREVTRGALAADNENTPRVPAPRA